MLTLSAISILATSDSNILSIITTKANAHGTVRGLLGCVIAFLIPYYCLKFFNDLLGKKYKLDLEALHLSKSICETLKEKGGVRTSGATIRKAGISFKHHEYSANLLTIWHLVTFLLTLYLSARALYLLFSETTRVLFLLF